MPTRLLTKQEVLKRIEDYCKPYVNYKAAAKAAGITVAQLSNARLDREPVPPKLLRKLNITREPLYVVEMEEKYRDGSMSM